MSYSACQSNIQGYIIYRTHSVCLFNTRVLAFHFLEMFIFTRLQLWQCIDAGWPGSVMMPLLGTVIRFIFVAKIP